MENYYKIIRKVFPDNVIRINKNVSTDRDVLDVVRKRTPQFILTIITEIRNYVNSLRLNKGKER